MKPKTNTLKPHIPTLILSIALILLLSIPTISANPLDNPLFHAENLKYIGGFRIKAGDFGVSRSSFNNGVLGYNPSRHSLFIGSKVHQNALGEFPIPERFVKSYHYSDMPITGVPIQNFSFVLDRTDTGNPQALDRLGGILYKNNQIIVQAYEYYDAPADDTHTTLVVRNASNIEQSDIDGYYEMEGRAHTVLWISPIPEEWQSLLGGDAIAGDGHGMPIASRCSSGPSLFVFNTSDLLNTTATNGTINATPLMDFDLSHIFADNEKGYVPYSEYIKYLQYNYNGTLPAAHDGDAREVYNISLVGNNSYWTQVSSAYYGVILPGTRTYAVFGSSAMHHSGGGYKIVQKNGNVCGGPCPYDPEDKYNYYWLFDLKDILQVKNGTKEPYEVKAYEYGELPLPFDKLYGGEHNYLMRDATFDEEHRTLYFSIPGMDHIQSWYEAPPVIVAYTYDLNYSNPLNRSIFTVLYYPLDNTTSEDNTHQFECAAFSRENAITNITLYVYNATDNTMVSFTNTSNRINLQADLPYGRYVWTCIACDSASVCSYPPENYTLSITNSSQKPECSSLGGNCMLNPCQIYTNCSSLNEGACTIGFCCSGTCQQPPQCSDADTDHNGRVNLRELVIYIKQWKSRTLDIAKILTAIKEWKNGC